MRQAFFGTAVCLALAAGALAVTDVEIRDYEFVPAMVAIMKGESVKWTNVGQVIHTSTSDSGKWDSGSLEHGQYFVFEFTTAGSFGYRCTPHPWMTATVRVTETAVEPTSYGRVKALFR